MKITRATPYLTLDGRNSALFLVLETDSGIRGYGEGTNHFIPQAPWGLLKDLCPYLIGQDPERIEYLWQMCYRRLFYRGGPATGAALSAIDMALWDIKGKAHDMPVYQLLGGLARDKVRLYGHVTGKTAAEAAAQARERVARGITAIRFRAFHSYDAQGLHDHRLAMRQQIEYLAALRDAVGDDVDLIVECHGRYDPEWAVKLAHEIEPFRPFMLEDPIRHENPHALAQLRQHTRVPLATGERYHDKWDFSDLIVHRYVDYLRPDVCHCGGLTEMRKIAALGEAFLVNLIPHNNAGPLGTAASLHVSLALNNVVLMEAPFVNYDAETDVVGPYPQVVDGYALPLEGPGLGIDLDEAMAASRPFVASVQPELRALDGSVRDF
ncbi:MAG: galactonate dehydratase [Anaerolineae bacterium]|nr:galactonate dehydratase [Anaerolineae bacterium]